MTIGFFMPLPLAMMIPFMGIQSAVMAKQFGENFQFGKRRISAMSNEAFNKLTPKILMENNAAEIRNMIPSMKESIHDMDEFQKFLIVEFLSMIKSLPADVLKFMGIDPRIFEEDYDAFVDSFTPKKGTFVDPRDVRPEQGPFDRPDVDEDAIDESLGNTKALRDAAKRNIASIKQAAKSPFTNTERGQFQSYKDANAEKQRVLKASKAAYTKAFNSGVRGSDLQRILLPFQARIVRPQRKIDAARKFIISKSSWAKYSNWLSGRQR